MSGFDYLKKPNGGNPFIAKAKDVITQEREALTWAETVPGFKVGEQWSIDPDNPIEVRGTVNHYVDTGHIEYINADDEIFIGYQDAANYVLLAGPYSGHGIAMFNAAKAWARFQADTSLLMSFPLDKRNRELLTTFSVPATAKRKGAYGKL